MVYIKLDTPVTEPVKTYANFGFSALTVDGKEKEAIIVFESMTNGVFDGKKVLEFRFANKYVNELDADGNVTGQVLASGLTGNYDDFLAAIQMGETDFLSKMIQAGLLPGTVVQ